MRLDGQGRRRFHYRGLNGIAGGTSDTWHEAYKARKQVKADAQKALDANAPYWPDMQTRLELVTRLDYQADLALLVRLAGHLSLGELQEKLGVKAGRHLEESRDVPGSASPGA